LKVIIVGAGEVGFHIAQRLSEEHQDVVLIDRDPEQIKRVADNLDVQALLGSGTSPKILKDTDIKNADMLVAATNSDEVNLISCLIAKNLNPYLVKVARLRNEEYTQGLPLLDKDHLGIDHVINPQIEMVHSIQRLMEIPGASEVIDFVGGKVKLIGVTVEKDSPFAGRPGLPGCPKRGTGANPFVLWHQEKKFETGHHHRRRSDRSGPGQGNGRNKNQQHQNY